MTIHFSDSIDKLAPALTLAQAQMGSAQLDSKNGHFRSRYASLASCLHAALSPLSEQGLSLLQHPSYDPSSQIVSVTTCIMHKSGQWMKSTCSLPLGGKRDGHALKSATTYLRRTTLVSILGLPEEDDDGNATSAVSVRKQPQLPASPAPVGAEDLKLYKKLLVDAAEGAPGFARVCAAFMKAHGKPPASELTASQLDARLQWLRPRVAMVVKWGEEQ